MVYHSQAWQDEFIANLFNFKKNGYFIDIGSTDGINQSNSYFFENELNWQGICIERGVGYTEHYAQNRTCLFLNEDALQIDYNSVLQTNNFPNRIDYLSLDIDENTANGLNKLPLDQYRFTFITIEHDSYRFGDTLKNVEREALRHHNYVLLCSDVLVPLGCGMGPNLPFEDWWIDPVAFNLGKIAKLGSDKMYPDDLVKMLKSKPDIYLL